MDTHFDQVSTVLPLKVSAKNVDCVFFVVGLCVNSVGLAVILTQMV
jgi:hypothetical protein